LIETVELLGDEDFLKSLRDYKSGRMKFKDVNVLDEN
jgi:hypothetical protein